MDDPMTGPGHRNEGNDFCTQGTHNRGNHVVEKTVQLGRITQNVLGTHT